LLTLLLLAGLSGCEATEAAERVALVIGNSEYTHAPSLSNPKRDAEAIARTLSGLGFEVTGPLLNQNKAQMDAALKAFGRRSQGATAAVVYFGGHGVEVGGRNYLLPTDVTLERERDVALEGVSLDVVVDQLGGASGYRLVILDACRDNPLAAQMQRTDGTRSTYRGLVPIEVSGQTYVAYAARAGQKAKDGTAGDHSPYVAALLKYLREPLPLPNLFGAVREEVRKATNGEQEPWLYGAFGREAIYLVGGEPTAVIATPVAAPAPVPVSPPVVAAPTVDHDYEAWKSAEKCGKAACFRAYIADYPKGRYARMALAQLEPEAVPAPVPVAVTPTPVEQPRLGMTGLAMVRITGGCFEMGSPAKETGREPDEMQHRVCVSDFELAPTELTVGEFKRFATATGYQTDAEKNAVFKGCYAMTKDGKWEPQAGLSWRKPGYKQGDDYPVACVSWNDATAYIQWLSQQTGQSYRLPTEAEWEYAARAGTVTARHWGDSPKQACQYANVADRAKSPTGLVWTEKHECSDGYWYPAPVRQFRPNPWGLYDMMGNIWEWTCSAYDKDYGGAEKECTNNTTGGPLAVRGGGWYFEPAWVRSANRGWNTPADRYDSSGFRLARSL
jgi:formylglycine-generating enzyme required for sulfatase activity